MTKNKYQIALNKIRNNVPAMQKYFDALQELIDTYDKRIDAERRAFEKSTAIPVKTKDKYRDICPCCDKPLSENDIYCPKCGQRVYRVKWW